MATQLDTAHALGLFAILDVGAETVTIGGKHYRAVVGTIDERDELEEGGVRKIQSVGLAIAVSDFDNCVAIGVTQASIPAIWSEITVRGQVLKIMNVTRDNAVIEITAGGLAE